MARQRRSCALGVRGGKNSKENIGSPESSMSLMCRGLVARGATVRVGAACMSSSLEQGSPRAWSQGAHHEPKARDAGVSANPGRDEVGVSRRYCDRYDPFLFF